MVLIYNLRCGEDLVFKHEGKVTRLSLLEKNVDWALFSLQNGSKPELLDIDYRTHYQIDGLPQTDFYPKVSLKTKNNKVDIWVSVPPFVRVHVERDRK
ncbi:MAG: hypothetical protein AABW51_00465 [Nanoarchaeota archaeon]